MNLRLAALLVLLASAACGRPPGACCPPAPTARVAAFGEKDTAIRVSTGDTFEIHLSSNPTTGFEWWIRTDLPRPPAELVGQFFAGDEGESMVGAGGEEIWVFRGGEAGTGRIVFDYLRPWETGVQPARSMEFTIRVD